MPQSRVVCTSSANEATRNYDQVPTRQSHYSTDTSELMGLNMSLLGTDEATATHVYGWAPTKQKSSTLSCPGFKDIKLPKLSLHHISHMADNEQFNL